MNPAHHMQGYGASSEPTLAERWAQMKPVIIDLYITQDMHLTTVINIMKRDYNFFAVEHSYKYYFNLWGVTKNIPGSVKDAAIVALRKRKNNKNSLPDVFYNNCKIDKKRLRRHIATRENKTQKDGGNHLNNNAFLFWNLPYRALRSSSSMVDHFSPFPVTPAYLRIGGTNNQSPASPTNVNSPINAPTPTTVALRNSDLNRRAQLFVQAKHDVLMKQLEMQEKRNLTTHSYQFWLFAFKTAKYWGYGPVDWTVDLLDFDTFKDRSGTTHASPNTPRSLFEVTGDIATPSSEVGAAHLNNQPSPLCRWTIHANFRNSFDDDSDDEYVPEYIDDREALDENERLYRWSSNNSKKTFEEKLTAALDTNSFSSLNSDSLPFALAQVAQATRSSPKELILESFGFSIMARNEEVFSRFVSKVEIGSLRAAGIYPFHLLTSYLDGSKTCCNLLDTALNNIAMQSARNCVPELYVDSHKHTVLDNLMINILKSHTSCPPVTVDDKWAKLKRFTGEEIDICGRWDADSACIRELFAEGRANIPIEWKHMFCHTSVQAICHSIGRLFGPMFAPSINTPSGLFRKSCQACRKDLVLSPLHSLVLVAFHLATSGCQGENLFGMLACLVCLLANGANPKQKVDISLEALMNRDTATKCTHESLDPWEFSQRVPDRLMEEWTDIAGLGWRVFCSMLQYARDESRSNVQAAPTSREERYFSNYIEVSDDSDRDGESSDYGSDDEEETCQHAKEHGNFYGKSKVIGKLWAAIQTELLTYRRITEEDPWMSENISMEAILDGLKNQGFFDIPLIMENMMTPYCQCGRFLDVLDEASVCVDEECTHYFANVDVWERAVYIDIPEDTNYCWYGFI